MTKAKAKAREESACKISNDIAEGIDCGETRDQLRDAVAWWADQCNRETQRVNALRMVLVSRASDLMAEAQKHQ